MFYEYFHGDTGAGVGASHQTGWTGAIARIMHLFASLDAQTILGAEERSISGRNPRTGRASDDENPFIHRFIKSTRGSG